MFILQVHLFQYSVFTTQLPGLFLYLVLFVTIFSGICLLFKLKLTKITQIIGYHIYLQYCHIIVDFLEELPIYETELRVFLYHLCRQ